MAPQILPDMSDRFKRRLNFLRRAVGPGAGGYRAATLLALAREGHGAAVIPMTAARAVGQKTLVASAATQSDCEAAFNSRTRRGAKRAPASASTSSASGRGNWSRALLILPDGQISKGRSFPVSSPFRKNILVFRRPNQFYIHRRPASPEGRFAIVTSVRRDAVDAEGAADEST